MLTTFLIEIAALVAPAAPADTMTLGDTCSDFVSATSAPTTAAEEPRSSGAPPWTGDGIVLQDGRRIAGSVEQLADGRVRVAPESGEPSLHERSAVALIESKGAVELLGDERAVEGACSSAARRELASALAPLFERALTAGLVDDARRFLERERGLGLDASDLGAQEGRLAKRRATKGAAADKERQKLVAAEHELDDRCGARLEDAARWCAGHGLWTSSAGLLRGARAAAPGRKLAAEVARALVPPGLLRAAEPDAFERWLALAEAMAPAGATLLASGDPLWAKAKGDAWKEGAFALRTPRIALFTREEAPVLLGDCLSRAEAALRALEREFGARDSFAGRAPLVVLLHKERVDYLAEDPPGGAAAPPWSAGYYSPTSGVSRFYVPRENKEPLKRDLAEVLVHELTHHWISQVWLGADDAPAHGDPWKPGFWIVEGTARFVEDQLLDLRGERARFDDPSARSVVVTADLARQERAFLCERLIDFSQADFARLSDDYLCTVRAGPSAERRGLSERVAFYEQAGALVFFFANRAGPERRAKLLDYARAWYAGKSEPEGWRTLGYASPEELEGAFAQFLADVRR